MKRLAALQTLAGPVAAAGRLRLVAMVVLTLSAPVAFAEVAFADSTAEHQTKRPDLFHPRTGLRVARFRAPTPDDVPGVRRITACEAQAMVDAIRLDVGPAASSRHDDLDGTWLVSGDHLSLPGAHWLPEVGRGELTPILQDYLARNLAEITGGDTTRRIVVFCIADCWMSWNAAQRITQMGYKGVHWFAEGTDGWLDDGLELVPVGPVPVRID